MLVFAGRTIMKTRNILLIVTLGLLGAAAQVALAQGPAGPTMAEEMAVAPLSGDLNEVLKLARAGMDESVILAYVQNSPIANQPSADEILRLRQAGVSPKVIAVILQHGGEVRAQQKDSGEAAQPAATTQTPSSTATYSAETPTTTSTTPTVYYTEPSSSYFYYSSPWYPVWYPAY